MKTHANKRFSRAAGAEVERPGPKPHGASVELQIRWRQRDLGHIGYVWFLFTDSAELQIHWRHYDLGHRGCFGFISLHL